MAGTPEAVLVQQDFNLIPLLNTVAEPVAGSVTASAGNVGRLYRNTSTGNLEYVLNATTVVHFTISGLVADADIASGANIALAKLAVNPLARANHTGTQLAATISDFDTQVRTSRLDQMAAPTADVSLGGHKAVSAADAVSATDLTTLQQVQNLISASVNGNDWKASVRVALDTNVNTASPGATLDGATMAAGDRVLLTGQTTASQNGIWVWNGAAVAMTRATDVDASAEVTSGMTVPITEGSHDNQIAILTTNDPITLGTTSLTFTYLSVGTTYVQGTGITITGNTISLTSPVTVGLGGTGSGTAAGARANLNTPQRGFASTLGALTAGSGVDVVHNLGTLDVIVQVVRVSDGATVRIGNVRKDTNTVTITADVAVSASALRVVVIPIA